MLVQFVNDATGQTIEKAEMDAVPRPGDQVQHSGTTTVLYSVVRVKWYPGGLDAPRAEVRLGGSTPSGRDSRIPPDNRP